LNDYTGEKKKKKRELFRALFSDVWRNVVLLLSAVSAKLTGPFKYFSFFPPSK
jgi:hypothetical protein